MGTKCPLIIGSNLAFLLGHLVGHFYGHTGLDLVQIWPNGQYVGPFVVAIIVGQHGTTSIEWMDQGLGGLQGLLVHQTILLELLLDLHPLGANWYAGVILDLGDELLQILVYGSTKANWSGYPTKGDTFSTMKFAMASHCGMPCCTHVNIWKALVALEAPMPLEQHTAEPTEAALSAKYTCELF